MTYTIKIGTDINTADIDAYYPSLGFGLYEAQDWEKVKKNQLLLFKC